MNKSDSFVSIAADVIALDSSLSASILEWQVWSIPIQSYCWFVIRCWYQIFHVLFPTSKNFLSTFTGPHKQQKEGENRLPICKILLGVSHMYSMMNYLLYWCVVVEIWSSLRDLELAVASWVKLRSLFDLSLRVNSCKNPDVRIWSRQDTEWITWLACHFELDA